DSPSTRSRLRLMPNPKRRAEMANIDTITKDELKRFALPFEQYAASVEIESKIDDRFFYLVVPRRSTVEIRAYEGDSIVGEDPDEFNVTVYRPDDFQGYPQIKWPSIRQDSRPYAQAMAEAIEIAVEIAREMEA